MAVAESVEVAIVGGGFSGIGAAIALSRAGFDDFLILEEGEGVGGAWYWNRYPGIGVDIPSFSYQFSFAQRADWSRVYAPGEELLAYARDCVREFGLEGRLRLGTRVTGAEWDEGKRRWTLSTRSGEELRARYVVGATGVFSQPQAPDIAGLEDFAGPAVHTARWPADLPLSGRRVALIGTGASAVQVVPAIAPQVRQLTVFQRTPIWCLPKLDGPIPAGVRRALTHVPGARWAVRAASQAFVELTFPLAAHYAGVVPLARWSRAVGLRHLRDQVHDPALRDRLTPRYDVGCKRPGFSNDYLRTFNRDNVALETSPIASVGAREVLTAAGTHGPFDLLVLATGFKVFDPGNMPPFPVRGAGGGDLEEFWTRNRFQAYQGVSIPGFPNLFMILGPYGFNGASYFTLIENQSRHIVRCLRHARRVGARRVEVTGEANARYLAQMLGRRHNQVFFAGSCAGAHSYYFDAHGDVPFRASSTPEVMWRSARFALRDYAFA